MRSALLVTLDYPPRLGGVAVYLSKLVDNLPIGRIQVLAPPDPDAHQTDMRSAAPIYRRSLVWRWLRPSWLPACFFVNWLCRKEGEPSAIIVSHLLPMGEMAYKIKRRRKIPYMVIVHGMDLALALSSGDRKRRNAERIIHAADMVVANSEYTARLAESLGAVKDRITVVRPSPEFPADTVVPEAKLAETRQKYGLEGVFTVLSVGRLVARKGFDIGIKALAELKNRGQKARLVIVGDGPERKRLEKLAAELDLAEAVVFAGAAAADELAALYSACDVLVMTPKSLGADVEGFGIVYLEANLFGKPAIGSRSGGVPEAVLHEETGLLVQPGDALELAEAVQRLASDPALKERLGANGRRRVLEQFGWPRQAAAFGAALDHITVGRLPAGR